jgi:cephalosporin hydroxylase
MTDSIVDKAKADQVSRTGTQYDNIGEKGLSTEYDYSKRFQRISEREFRSETSENDRHWEDHGKYRTHWHGIKMLKDVKSLQLTYQLLFELQPGTVFEFGTYRGGFTEWLADNLQLLDAQNNKKTIIYTFDRWEETVNPVCRKDERINFVFDDVHNLEKHLTPELMEKLPHPWIVFEDCHVNITGTFDLFRKYMTPGDYLWVEDLSNVSPDQTSYNPYKKIQNKKVDGSEKRKELFDWVADKEEEFMVDAYLCDFFGYNGSVQWDGIMRKMK